VCWRFALLSARDPGSTPAVRTADLAGKPLSGREDHVAGTLDEGPDAGIVDAPGLAKAQQLGLLVGRGK